MGVRIHEEPARGREGLRRMGMKFCQSDAPSACFMASARRSERELAVAQVACRFQLAPSGTSVDLGPVVPELHLPAEVVYGLVALEEVLAGAHVGLDLDFLVPGEIAVAVHGGVLELRVGERVPVFLPDIFFLVDGHSEQGELPSLDLREVGPVLFLVDDFDVVLGILTQSGEVVQTPVAGDFSGLLLPEVVVGRQIRLARVEDSLRHGKGLRRVEEDIEGLFLLFPDLLQVDGLRLPQKQGPGDVVAGDAGLRQKVRDGTDVADDALFRGLKYPVLHLLLPKLAFFIGQGW